MAVSSDLTSAVRWCGCPVNAEHSGDCPIGKVLRARAPRRPDLFDRDPFTVVEIPAGLPLVWDGDQA